MRLTIPCRAVTCTHLQCFDAALYLQVNEKKPTWICLVYDKKAAYESLILDGLFMEILNDCSDVDEIKFQEDGSWCPMRPKKEAMKVTSQPSSHIFDSHICPPLWYRNLVCRVWRKLHITKPHADLILSEPIRLTQ